MKSTNNLITLGIETSSEKISIALINGKYILANSQTISYTNHDKHIIPIIKNILTTSKTKKENIKLIAVSCGPGAFTSIRVGVASARALAQFNNIPIVAVNTLDTLKENVQEILLKEKSEQFILSIINAKQNKVYASIYHKTNNIEKNLYINIHTLINKLKNIINNKPLLIIGNATEKYKNIFTTKLNKIYTLSDYYNYPQGHNVALLGQKIFNEKKGNMHFNKIKPFYINEN